MNRDRSVRSAWQQWRDGVAAVWRDYREWYQADRLGCGVMVMVMLFTVVALGILGLARLSWGWYLLAILVVAIVGHGAQVLAYRKGKRNSGHSKG